VTGHRQAGHRAPGVGEEDDVSWIAEMEKIPGVGSGKINPACLNSNAATNHVAARFRFDLCEVASAFPPRFKDKVFQFGSGAGAYAQALAIPSIRAVASGAGLTLTFQNFSGSPTGGTISVKPGEIGSPTNFYIYNKPHDEIACSTNDDVRKLMHFGAFYQLLETTVNNGPIPTCVGDNCPVCPTTIGGIGSSEDIHCPSGAFGRK